MNTDAVRHHDDVLVMLTRRNLLALAWYDAPRPGHLLAVLRVVEDLHRAHGKYGLLDAVVRGTPNFPEQVREEGRQLIAATAGRGGVTAHIIEVEGFAAAEAARVRDAAGLERVRAAEDRFRGLAEAAVPAGSLLADLAHRGLKAARFTGTSLVK
jgi:hypothetical protein